MQGTVAVTDFGWYDYLQPRARPEVNFWTPSDKRPFSAPLFSPFFFKLKAPHRAIAGYGFFAKWSSLPDWLAWDCFHEGNGCYSLEEMRLRIGGIRRRIGYIADTHNANIGCILIVQPIFFPRESWIAQPEDWSDRIVTTRSYDLSQGEGLRIWEACLERSPESVSQEAQLPQVAGTQRPRYGTPRAIVPRLGQGTFRISVTDAYGRSCAVTDEHSLPVLEAAHIRAYSKEGPHEIRNGILLRADLHRLFDKGYLTITPHYGLEVSSRLKADYSNGRSYYPFHGTTVSVPHMEHDRPSPEFLSWHNDNVFLG